MTALVIELAGEPRGKGRPRFVRGSGRAYTPEGTRSYEGALRYAACEAMRGKPLMEGPLSVSMLAVFAVPSGMTKGKQALALTGRLRPMKAPDSDNILKVADALNQIVWLDDKQIVEASISKFFGDRPRLVITIKPWSAPDAESAALETGRGATGADVAANGVGSIPLSSPRGTGVPT